MTDTDMNGSPERGGFVSWREFLGQSDLSALSFVSLAVWLHAADGLITATMLPSLVRDIGGAALVSWTVSLYQIGSIVAGASSALMTLRYGLRLPMSLAALLFGAGCILSALAPTMEIVLVGRTAQGLGGGALVAMAFIAVGTIFPRRYAARALAAIAFLWGVSAFLGPLVGGLFVEYATWRWGFGFFALQALSLAGWIAARGPRGARTDRQVAPLPLRRLALLCLAVLLVATAGVVISPFPAATLIAAGLFCLAGFLRLDGSAGENRLLPRRPFDPRHATGAALLIVFAFSAATVALLTYGPLLMTAIHHTQPLEAGYIIAASSIGWTTAAIAVSGSPERRDRKMIATGMTLVACSVAGFVWAMPHGPLWLVAAFAVLQGGGFGTAWTFILRLTTALAEDGEAQRVSGALPTVQRLAFALGAAYVGIVANASGFLTMTTPAEAAATATWIFAACLPFAGLGLFATILLLRPRSPLAQT